MDREEEQQREAAEAIFKDGLADLLGKTINRALIEEIKSRFAARSLIFDQLLENETV